MAFAVEFGQSCALPTGNSAGKRSGKGLIRSLFGTRAQAAFTENLHELMPKAEEKEAPKMGNTATRE